MKTLTAPPSLGALYARAALTGPLHRGDALPEAGYELAPQTIDARHLADYDKVCGFRYSDVLPATYLHVLAFPLQVALMTERAFPFPLVGMVHLANEITVHRPVSVADEVAFNVRAADLRAHPAGRQLDLVSEARVDGELAWSGRSTYLRREKASEQRTKTGTEDKRTAPAHAVAGLQLRVGGDTGRRYAAVSGDRNPIHLYGLTAKAFGFPAAIAHGMWLKARTLATLEGRLPDAYTVAVAFKTPLLLPSTVAVYAAADDTAGAGWALDVRNARSGKPHLSGSVQPS